MPFLTISPDQFKLFVLIFIRVSVVLFMFPVFGSAVIPALVKAGLALLLTFVLFPGAGLTVDSFPDSVVQTGILVISELFIGIVLGLSVRLFFASVQLAGQIVGFQMGFSIINVVDPLSGSQVSIIDQFGYWVVLLIFLLLNGHHALILALGESFHIVAPGWISLNQKLLHQVVSLSVDMFSLAIKIGAPAIAALLLTSSAFGLCAKFVPQMNILIAAFPVKIIMGLIFFGMSFQIIAIFARSYLKGFASLLRGLLTHMAGG